MKYLLLASVLLLSSCTNEVTNTDIEYSTQDTLDDSEDNMQQAIFNLWNQR